MSLALIVYLISVIPNVSTAASIIFLLICFGAIFPIMLGFIEGEWKPFKAVYKKIVILVSVCLTLMIFIPSERTMYTMLAAYGVEKVATNEKTQDILGNGVDILNLQLQKYKEELTKEKSK